MKLNNKLIDNRTIQVDGVDSRDYPDFCDAYFSYAQYTDGTNLTDDELNQLTEDYGDVVNEMACEQMIGMAEDYSDMER